MYQRVGLFVSCGWRDMMSCRWVSQYSLESEGTNPESRLNPASGRGYLLNYFVLAP